MRVQVNKRVACTTLLLLLAIPLRADEASKTAKIKELFNVMQMQKTFDQMIDQSSRQGAQAAMNMFPDVKLTQDQQGTLDASLAEIRAVTHDGLSWSKLEPQFVRIYAENYSEATVDGLLQFYRSPAGTEMLAKQPVLLAQSGAVVQKASVEMQPRLQAIVQKLMREMQSPPAPPK